MSSASFFDMRRSFSTLDTDIQWQDSTKHRTLPWNVAIGSRVSTTDEGCRLQAPNIRQTEQFVWPSAAYCFSAASTSCQWRLQQSISQHGHEVPACSPMRRAGLRRKSINPPPILSLTPKQNKKLHLGMLALRGRLSSGWAPIAMLQPCGMIHYAGSPWPLG